MEEKNYEVGATMAVATLWEKTMELQFKLKRRSALVLSAHCYGHSLNPGCDNSISNSTVVSKTLDASYEITRLVKFSTKPNAHLRQLHEEEYYQNEDYYTSKLSTLRLFSENRWTVRASSLKSIHENYKELEELWEWRLDECKNREPKARMQSLRCKPFSIFLDLVLLFYSLGMVITSVHRYRLKICVPWKLRKFRRKPTKSKKR